MIMSSYCQVARVLGADGRALRLSGHVGFDSLPDQLAKKCVKRGFDFNILCIGETGIGKSTLMDSLFNTSFQDTPVTHKQPEVTLDEHTYELQESGVNLRLTVVSTAGYGDQINTDNSCQAMIEYIDCQFESYFQEELKIKRDLMGFHDTRIHACLFLISPIGHSIKNLDLMCMKELHEKVNIIPVIAKADTISCSELPEFKSRIMEDLQSCDIQIYQFPTDDAMVADLNARMNADQLPFAVVGSREEVVVYGHKVRGRQYPWGVLEVENKAHCEFAKLREKLLGTNMEDLRESTHFNYYEVYRRKRLQEMFMQKPIQTLEDEFEYRSRQITEETQELDEKMKQLDDMKRELNDKKKQLEDKEKQQEEETKAVQADQQTQEQRNMDDLQDHLGANFHRGIQPVH